MAANVVTRIAGTVAGCLRGLGLVRARRPKDWSIGIYAGASPLRVSPAEGARNPVLTARDVTDVPAEFVADPFLFRDGATWHMFFEAMSARTRRGVIARATSDDALAWAYRGVALDEPFHLSYPGVFRWDNDIYMIPESCPAGVRLYRAERFPDRWAFASTLLARGCVDPTAFERDGRWWLFAGEGNRTLRLFYAERLTGPWREHPRSPVVRGDGRVARPAGRVVIVDGTPVRFAQDCAAAYGSRVRAFEVVRLTTQEYEERAVDGSPVLEGSGRGWNADGMHHLDAHPLGGGRWIAAVDGFRYRDGNR